MSRFLAPSLLLLVLAILCLLPQRPHGLMCPSLRRSRAQLFPKQHYLKDQRNDNEEIGDIDELISFRGEESDDMPAELWERVEENRPSQWMIMKDLLGINIFTVVLAILIAFFLGMNTLLGPGWLGQKFSGTGNNISPTERLPNTPNTINLNDPSFLLPKE